jgi:hypothetical protein
VLVAGAGAAVVIGAGVAVVTTIAVATTAPCHLRLCHPDYSRYLPCFLLLSFYQLQHAVLPCS